jgi:hypothetical protein
MTYPNPTVPAPSSRALCAMLDTNRDVAYATDGCPVEPDGTCPHGHVSWLVYLGLI